MDSLISKIPNLKIKVLSEDNYAIKTIEGTIQLQAWSGYQNKQGPYQSIDSDKLPDGTATLMLGGDMVVENPEITQEHVNAYDYLTRYQEEVKEAILQALLLAYKDLQEQYGYEPDDASLFMPNVDNINEFRNLIELSTVHLLNVSKDNMAYTGYQFGCSWDDEHGLGIMTHRNRIVEIGDADTSFLTWIAEKDIDPETVNADIEATYNPADGKHNQELKKISKRPWWRFW